MKDLADALGFGAQVCSAVRSAWVSLAGLLCLGRAAALCAAEMVEHPPKGFLWRKSLLPFLLSLHRNVYYTEIEVGCSIKCGF